MELVLGVRRYGGLRVGGGVGGFLGIKNSRYEYLEVVGSFVFCRWRRIFCLKGWLRLEYKNRYYLLG